MGTMCHIHFEYAPLFFRVFEDQVQVLVEKKAPYNLTIVKRLMFIKDFTLQLTSDDSKCPGSAPSASPVLHHIGEMAFDL